MIYLRSFHDRKAETTNKTAFSEIKTPLTICHSSLDCRDCFWACRNVSFTGEATPYILSVQIRTVELIVVRLTLDVKYFCCAGLLVPRRTPTRFDCGGGSGKHVKFLFSLVVAWCCCRRYLTDIFF